MTSCTSAGIDHLVKLPLQSLQSLNLSENNLNNVGYDKQAKHIEVLCSIDVNVTYQNQKKQLILLVVSGDGPSLLGQDWLQQTKLDWSGLLALSM